jgi:tetratricopeptide (TPR) repeat protein
LPAAFKPADPPPGPRIERSALSMVPAKAPLTDKSVLIVDPFEAPRSILRDMATQLGCRRLRMAGTYADAMRSLRKADTGVDVIFCEYNLNGTRDGQQMLEELRVEQAISMATAFFMVTGEAGYKRVVAVAEFAPDDYIVKPYSAEYLRQRLVRTLHKKETLATAYALIDSGQSALAADECMRIAETAPEYAVDCWRLAFDLLTGLGQSARAEEVLERVLQRKAVPWALLGLARIRAREGRLDEAVARLESLLAENPEFLRVRDTLAELKIKLGKEAEALQILEAAADLSSSNVGRLRRVGELAEAMGDAAKAEAAYGKVLERTRDSAMVSGDDYVNLSRMLVAQGKLEEAERLAGDQRRMMKGHKDLELSTAMLAFHRLQHTGGDAAAAALQKLIDIEALDEGGEISPRLVVQVVRACLGHGAEDKGLRIAGKMARRTDLPAEVLSDIRDMLDRHHADQLRNKAMSLETIDAAIAAMLENGFDEEIARRIERSLPAVIRSADPTRVDLLQRQWAGLKARFGMAR